MLCSRFQFWNDLDWFVFEFLTCTGVDVRYAGRGFNLRWRFPRGAISACQNSGYQYIINYIYFAKSFFRRTSRQHIHIFICKNILIFTNRRSFAPKKYNRFVINDKLLFDNSGSWWRRWACGALFAFGAETARIVFFTSAFLTRRLVFKFNLHWISSHFKFV